MSNVDWSNPRGPFMLAPDEIYLNAGTYSALPRPVFEALTRIMADAELNPTRRAAWNKGAPLRPVQEGMARYLGADPDDIVFHVNITQALNQALFCLPWPSEGEFLMSDLEYGAIAIAAREMARRRGLSVRVFELPRQPKSSDELMQAILAQVSPATVGMLLSHVVAATGMVTPVERLAPHLRERKVQFIVDGAHAPGLLPLALGSSGVAAYGGNLHKWFMGPKGTAFLYVARSLHAQMRPHIVGFGGANLEPRTVLHNDEGESHPFQRAFQIQGLHDASPFLALQATLDYRAALGEENILRRIAALGAHVRRRIGGELGLPFHSPPPEMNAGLISFQLPESADGRELEKRLFERYRITVAAWREKKGLNGMRVSAHIWNSESDIDRLAQALKELL